MTKDNRDYPHIQPFNVSPRPNKTKNPNNAWWGHPPYHNNYLNKKLSKVAKETKDEQT